MGGVDELLWPGKEAPWWEGGNTLLVCYTGRMLACLAPRQAAYLLGVATRTAQRRAQEAGAQGDHEVMRIGRTWTATGTWRRAHRTLKLAGRPRRTADHLELPSERCQHSDVHGEPCFVRVHEQILAAVQRDAHPYMSYMGWPLPKSRAAT